MVFVMVQGPRIVGVFDSAFHAKCHFSDATGIPMRDIKVEEGFCGDLLIKVNDYTQARLKKATYY